MPTFLTEPQWYDPDGNLVGPETFIANSAKSLQALSGSIFGDVAPAANQSKTPIYILPKITGTSDADVTNKQFPESDRNVFYAMLLDYIWTNYKYTDNGKTYLREGIYIGAEAPDSRQTIVIYVYPDYTNSTFEVTHKKLNKETGEVTEISVVLNAPAWSHGFAFTLGGSIETFGTTYNSDQLVYSYQNGINSNAKSANYPAGFSANDPEATWWKNHTDLKNGTLITDWKESSSGKSADAAWVKTLIKSGDTITGVQANLVVDGSVYVNGENDNPVKVATEKMVETVQISKGTDVGRYSISVSGTTMTFTKETS